MRIKLTELAKEKGVAPKGETLGFAHQVEKYSMGFLKATVYVRADGGETVMFCEENGKIHELRRM